MKVSVLMCAYNAASYIDEAIQSVIAQTYNDWELLISNDASTDDTKQIIEKYLSDKRIKLFNQPENLGYLDNKNWLFKQAGGELITQLDADDTCCTNRLEKQVQVFINHPAIMIYGTNHKLIDPAGNLLQPPVTHEHDLVIKEIQLEYPFWYSSLMFRKELVDEFGLFSSYFAGIAGDDQHWTFKVNQRYPIYFLKDVLYHYRIHPESYTNVLNNERKLITPEILAELFRQRQETGTDLLEVGMIDKMKKFEHELFSNSRLMAEKYRLWAAKAVDKKDWDQAKSLLKKSLHLNRWNKTTNRTLLYFLRSQAKEKGVSVLRSLLYFVRPTLIIMPLLYFHNIIMALSSELINTCDINCIPEYLVAS